MKFGVLWVFFTLFLSSPASASDYLLVPDMSLLKYQIYNDRLNIRNLNAFDNTSTWQGCCEIYYVDLTSATGKAILANILSAIAMKKRLYIGVTSKLDNPSKVTYVGDW